MHRTSKLVLNQALPLIIFFALSSPVLWGTL